MKRIFSFSETETKKSVERIDKIELVTCPLREMMCRVHLSAINKIFLESEKCRIEKKFNESVENLKNAFEKATDLMDHPCTKCAQNYRLNIIESLEKLYDELEEITSGIFGNKNFQKAHSEAGKMLKQYGNLGINNKYELNELKGRFLGNHLN